MFPHFQSSLAKRSRFFSWIETGAFSVINSQSSFHVTGNLGQFSEFIQSVVDIVNLFHCFILFCSEESNLNVWWLVHSVLHDCDTHPPRVVCC